MDDKQKATLTVVSGAYVRSLAEAAILYSRQALISTDVSGLINAWNPAAEQMFGYSSADALGMPLMALIPAEGSAEHSRIQREVADGLVVEATDTVWLRREGTRLNVAVTTTALFDADNRVLGTASAIVDISVRKQLEARLAFLESIISSSSDAIFTRDMDRRLITSWNEAAERLFGYRADEMIGQPIAVLIPPELRESEFLEVAARIRHGVRVEPYHAAEVPGDIAAAVKAVSVLLIADRAVLRRGAGVGFGSEECSVPVVAHGRAPRFRHRSRLPGHRYGLA
jgi:PAS domain S-box-containing protein